MTTFPSYSDNVTLIFQFKAPYQLSEITEDIRSKMVQAVANLLSVETSRVVLTFVPVQVRLGQRGLLQQTSVLVNVGLTNFHESASIMVSQLTQENINLKMHDAGLKSVQLVTTTTSNTAGMCSKVVKLEIVKSGNK
jgi:hypothetical protein